MLDIIHKPILAFCLFYVAATFALYYCDTFLRITCITVFAVLFIVLALCCLTVSRNNKTAVLLMLITLSFLLAGIRTYFHYDVYKRNVLSNCRENAYITAKVLEVDRITNYGSTYTVRVISVDGDNANFRSKLEFPNETVLDISDIVTVSGTVSVPDEYSGSFPLRKYYSSSGIYTVINTEKVEDFSAERDGIIEFFTRLSLKISAKLKIVLGNDTGNLASAILLGKKDILPDSVKRDFRFSGVSHIFAVSGLHLTIIVGFIIKLLRLIGANRTVQHCVCTAAIIGMMLLTGFSPSVIRAGIMLHFVTFSLMTGHVNDTLTTLFSAAAIILTFSPESVADAGFLLSFSATLGIITLGSRSFAAISRFFHGQKKVKKRIIKSVTAITGTLAVSLSAVLFTLPFIYAFFGELSVVSLLSNLLYIPLTTVFLPLSVISLIFADTPLIYLLSPVTKYVGNIMLKLARVIAETAPEPISLRYGFTKFVIFAVILSLIGIFLLKKRCVFHYFIPAATFVALFTVCLAVHNLSINNTVFCGEITKSNNDCLAVHSGGKTLICDISDGSYSIVKSAAEFSADKFRDTSPDTVLYTHLHSNHIRSFGLLTDNNRISYLVLPLGTNEDENIIYHKLTEIAENNGIEVISYDPDTDSQIGFSNCTIRIYTVERMKRSTQPVNVLSVSYGERSLLYLGASALETERRDDLIADAEKADSIWLGTHGPVIKMILPEISCTHIRVSRQEVNTSYGTDYPVINDTVILK